MCLCLHFHSTSFQHLATTFQRPKPGFIFQPSSTSTQPPPLISSTLNPASAYIFGTPDWATWWRAMRTKARKCTNNF